MDAPFTPEDALSPAFRHKHHLPSFEESYGAIFIGTLITLVLYGMSLEQTYRYVSLSWARDALVLKFIVIGLVLTDTFHCAFIMHMCYHYLVTDFGNYYDLLFLTWSLKLLPLVTGANFVFAQSFYLRRIYLAKFGYRALISSIIVTLMLVEVVLIIITTVETIMQYTFIKKVIIERVTTALSYDVAIVVDCSLTGALVAILRKNRTVFKETNNILNSLALYAVIATTLTTLSTIPITISTLIRPHNFIWIALTMPATKVYTISVLTMLNLRASLRRGGRVEGQVISIPETVRRSVTTRSADDAPQMEVLVISHPALPTPACKSHVYEKHSATKDGWPGWGTSAAAEVQDQFGAAHEWKVDVLINLSRIV